MKKRLLTLHTTIVGIKPDGTKLVANGRVDGHILHQLTGENGFRLWPAFACQDELVKSMAQAHQQAKRIKLVIVILRSFMKQFARLVEIENEDISCEW